jgi:hypothetical protein
MLPSEEPKDEVMTNIKSSLMSFARQRRSGRVEQEESLRSPVVGL